jgi:hypothetical protein
MSYYGRNHEEVWSLSATAYGARVAERLPSTSPDRRARYEALAQRALGRLRAVHLGGPAGVWPIPALAIDAELARPAIDHGGYAPFGGLGLMFLDWIADLEAPNGAGGDRIFSDTGGTAILGRQDSLFATQRRGRCGSRCARGRASSARPTSATTAGSCGPSCATATATGST